MWALWSSQILFIDFYDTISEVTSFFFVLARKKGMRQSIQQLGGNKGIIDSPVKLTCKVREKHSVWHEDLSTDYFI